MKLSATNLMVLGLFFATTNTLCIIYIDVVSSHDDIYIHMYTEGDYFILMYNTGYFHYTIMFLTSMTKLIECHFYSKKINDV